MASTLASRPTIEAEQPIRPVRGATSLPDLPSEPSARPILVWWLLILLASALYTLAIIRESLSQGRLTFPPTFDDVTYMLDGARRTIEFYHGGVLDVLRGYAHQPPHSPYSCALAALGFLLFGMSEWAPYAMNFVLVVGIAAMINFSTRRRPLWERTLYLLALAPVPMIIMAVHEFRPDIASAVAQTAAVLICIDRVGAPTSRRSDFVAGALFGAAILAKPPAFPAVLVLMAGALTLSIAAEWRSRQRPIPDAGRRALAAGAGLALVAGPHMALDGRFVWTYISWNMLGPGKRLWAHSMSIPDQLRYYIDGPGGDFMLGHYAWPILALILLSTVVALARLRRNMESSRRWLSLVALLGGLWLISTVNAVKQQFFAAPFHMLLITMALLSIRDLRSWIAHPRAPRALWPAFLTTLTLVSLLTFRWPAVWGAATRLEPLAARRAVDTITKTIAAKAGGRQVTMFLTFTGLLNGPNLELASLRAGADLRTRSLDAAQSLDAYRAQLSWATFVLTADPGTGLATETFPSAALLVAAQSLLHSSPDWREIATIPGVSGHASFHLYQRLNPP